MPRIRLILLSFLTLTSACVTDKAVTEARKENPPPPPVITRDIPATPAKKDKPAPNKEARKEWEQKEAEKVKKHASQDHKTCAAKGYFIGKPEDPKTEAYHDCRAHLAEQRVSPPPPATGYTPDHLPKVVRAIRHQADLARHAFDGRDYQDHLSCMDKGFFPSKPYEPQTEKYYQCRADLARTGLGNVVADLFTEDAAKAHYAAKEYATCTSLGFAYGTGRYGACHQAYNQYLACKQQIPSQLQARHNRDNADCNQKARLEFPSKLAQSTTQTITPAGTNGKTSRSTTSARYTPAELDHARAGTAAICMNERETARDEYRLQREYACEKIMSNIPLPTR